MPCPHNEISIVQRSHRQSAVAAAAYQSGEKLFCEYDQEVKHYPEKRGIVHNEILLPANAPLEYTDRNTLWNAAEAVEKQWNSQLARRWVLSIPREIPPDQYAALVRDFCRQQFVSKGMCVDFAIHDKGDGNPHAHVMLTMRAMDERGKWLPKSRKVYELDKNGERIKLPSGRWKSHKEDTVDWNDRKYGEIWRHEWEVIQNRYLEANNRPERVDLRSYERQGLDIIPTVHEGAAVRQMEKRGIQTNIGNLNREIKAANSLMKSIRQLIKNLKGWIAELSEKRNELLAQKAAEEAVFLPNLLMKYMEIRKAERSSWTRAGQSRGTSKDLKAVTWFAETGVLYQIQFSLVHDTATLYLDTTGTPLHKRGYRPAHVAAPLRETLAAALVDIAGYRGRGDFCDPFCGSGTIAIEAALAAKGRAPGLNRDFAAMQWAWLPTEIWPQAREEARAREFHGDYHIFASDIDPRAVAMARENARRAGVDDCITFAVADARDFDRTTDRGVIVTNPPYGERLMEKREAEALYTAFGAAYARTEHWRLYLLSSHTEFERAFGRPADKKRKLYNGTLRCDLFQYTRDV